MSLTIDYKSMENSDILIFHARPEREISGKAAQTAIFINNWCFACV